MKPLVTVDELNRIQAAWMALQSDWPEAEKQKVFRDMKEKYPKIYVSGHDGAGVCIIDGIPWSRTKTFDQALADCRELGGSTQVAWNGALGRWYAI